MDNEYLGFKELVVTGEEVNDLFNPESEYRLRQKKIILRKWYFRMNMGR